jgi:hypothetical protein
MIKHLQLRNKKLNSEQLNNKVNKNNIFHLKSKL